MAEVLSQTEIDALLAAVSSGSLETEAEESAKADGGRAGDWIAYDLTSQEKIVRGKLAALSGIHERFARLFRSTLSQTLKKNVSVHHTGTDFIRFQDYLGTILLPTSLNIVHLGNLNGYMVFVATSKLTYALVDSYYGGSERPYSKIGGREQFTSIETNMIKKLSMLALRDMKEAWKLNYPIEPEYLRAESNPHFVGSIHGSETVAVVTFEVELENLSGPFVVILQIKALDPILSSLLVNVTSEVQTDQELWRKHWVSELQELELVVRVRLGHTEKTISELNALKVGDTILLGEDAAGTLPVMVENIEKLRGLLGTCRGNRAVRVTDIQGD